MTAIVKYIFDLRLLPRMAVVNQACMAQCPAHNRRLKEHRTIQVHTTIYIKHSNSNGLMYYNSNKHANGVGGFANDEFVVAVDDLPNSLHIAAGLVLP